MSKNTDILKHFEQKLTGGVYVHKDEKLYEPTSIQIQILHDLVKKFPPQVFQTQGVNTMTKNTYDIHCRNCGSENVHVDSIQLRAADEATSKIYTCLDCGSKWRVG